jgi:2,3-bisphosphoglycerate-dependent phosphoglycerate mutase
MGLIDFVDIILTFMSYLILLRHGQSEWNKKNLFTGWIDIPLSEEGVEEALQAGREIKDYPLDVVYTSTLIRGIMTAMLALLHHSSKKVPVLLHTGEGKQEEWGKCYDADSEKGLLPVIRAWELNERMYGELQGKNKQKMREEYGEEQIKIWRRSYATPPPHGESLKMTAERTLPYFQREIIPQLKEGKNILISAHGNSLRSIVMHLDHLTEEDVLNLEIPTGRPLVYHYRDYQIKRVV